MGGDAHPNKRRTALEVEDLVWVETVTEGGWRFMTAWREEEVDAARSRQEKGEATGLGRKLLYHTEAYIETAKRH